MPRWLPFLPGAIALTVIALLVSDQLEKYPETVIWLAAHIAAYAAGAYVVVRRPDNRAGRRLLGLGTALMMMTGATLAVGSTTPSWAAVTLVQGLELATPATLLALLAVYPDGAYRRSFERRAVRAAATLPLAVPLILLVTSARLPQPVTLSWTAQEGYTAPSSPLDVSVLEPLGTVAVAVQPYLFHMIVLGAVALFALRYGREDHAGRLPFAWPMYAGVLLALTGAADQERGGCSRTQAKSKSRLRSGLRTSCTRPSQSRTPTS